MTTISYTELSNNIDMMLKMLDADGTSITVTRGGKSFVIMPFDEYHSLEETAYLLRSPKNTDWLKQAENDFQAKRNYTESDSNREMRILFHDHAWVSPSH